MIMINLVPPTLAERIYTRMEIARDRLYYIRPEDAPKYHTDVKSQLVMPFASFFRSSITEDKSRRSTPGVRPGRNYCLIEPSKEDYSNIRMLPVDLVFNLEIFSGEITYIDEMIGNWYFWMHSSKKEGTPSLQVPIMDRTNPANPTLLYFENQIFMGDPIDNSIALREQEGLSYRFTFPLTVKSFVVRFGTVKSILRIDASFYKGKPGETLALLQRLKITETGVEDITP